MGKAWGTTTQIAHRRIGLTEACPTRLRGKDSQLDWVRDLRRSGVEHNEGQFGDSIATVECQARSYCRDLLAAPHPLRRVHDEYWDTIPAHSDRRARERVAILQQVPFLNTKGHEVDGRSLDLKAMVARSIRLGSTKSAFSRMRCEMQLILKCKSTCFAPMSKHIPNRFIISRYRCPGVDNGPDVEVSRRESALYPHSYSRIPLVVARKILYCFFFSQQDRRMRLDQTVDDVSTITAIKSDFQWRLVRSDDCMVNNSYFKRSPRIRSRRRLRWPRTGQNPIARFSACLSNTTRNPMHRFFLDVMRGIVQ